MKNNKEKASQDRLNYCLFPSESVVERIEMWRSNVSRLPSVSVSEIASNADFADMWEDHVGERRRWYELTQMLSDAGWTRKRMRSLFYLEGEYETRVGSRWFPPIQTQD